MYLPRLQGQETLQASRGDEEAEGIMSKFLKSDPYAQGLDRDLAIHLVTATRAPTKQAQARYCHTPHFRALREAAVEVYGTCVLCGRTPESTTLTIHHRNYRHLFEEDIQKDVVLICQRCHRKYHGK